MIAVALLFAAAASATVSPTCTKLADDFVSNERFFAQMHQTDAELLKIEQQSPGPNARDRVDRARADLERTDEKYKREGDRITTLLVANKCTPPDHVTSWVTYSSRR
jgi:hypothetical protein